MELIAETGIRRSTGTAPPVLMMAGQKGNDMMYTNHLDTAAFSPIALDSLMETLHSCARKYNLMRKAKDPANDAFWQQVFGMTASVRLLGIGTEIEFDDDIEYIQSIRLWCGEYDTTRILTPIVQ